MQIPTDVQKAYQIALMSRLHAYAPYSKFQVGAALSLKDVEEVVGGCNVENASFGATICAERGAYLQAISRFGKIVPKFLVVVTAEAQATVPCALCLQVMAEFSADDMPVYLGNLQGVQKQLRLRDLLPYPFRQFAVVQP